MEVAGYFNLSIEKLGDMSILKDFECGVPQMDNFLHTTFTTSVKNHYCNAYSVKSGSELVALFALSFDSLELDDDDTKELLEGISSAGQPNLTLDYMDVFQCKRHYPALEITYLAVSKKYQRKHIGRSIIRQIANRARNQELAGCQFLTVEALKTEPYSAVGFYYNCHFTPCELLNQNKETLRMFLTLFPKDNSTI